MNQGLDLTGMNPAPFAPMRLGPTLGTIGHMHQKHHDAVGRTVLLVAIDPDRVFLQYAAQAGLFPCLQQSGFPGALTLFNASLRNDPATSAAGVDQADPLAVD